MSKNLLQDIVRIKRVSREVQAPKMEPRVDVRSNPVQNNKSRSRHALWIVAVISVVFFLFALSYMFLKVTVAVNPKIQDVVLNQSLSASKDVGATEVLPFDLIVISGEEDKTIQATEEKNVSRKAQGVVVIYNTFSSAPQRLSIDTRLEGSNGKIYKTNKAIVVEGMKGGIPGSVEVGIYAAEGGDGYNSGPLDFTIFGFKGTSKYSKFYARSKGDITGGFKGNEPTISDEQKSSTINDLKIALETKLFKKATDQIPSGFILFKDAAFLNAEVGTVKITFPEKDKMSFKLSGTLYGFLFNEDKLTKKIVESNITQYDGSAVYIANIRDLIFSISDKDNDLFGDVKNIDFSLKGTAKIVWKLDESQLINDLLGKPKKDFNKILLKYPNIDSADLTISPFWKRSLPNKTKDVKVIVNYPR